MPRSGPHPLALFSLVPINERAKDVVAHPLNAHLVSRLKDGGLALDVGFHIRSKSRDVLATLGRGDNTDIFVAGASIARIQCSFEIDRNTNVIMLYDRSYGQTTQVPGENAVPFECGRPRKVVVQNNLNTTLGMGGKERKLIEFELTWYQTPAETIDKVKNREKIAFGYEENPRLAQTIYELETVSDSQMETRPHIPGKQQPTMRYATVHKLGSGQFGEVHKAVDVYSGKLMAVKLLKRPVGSTRLEQEKWKSSVYYALKREVETLAEINHPHIVDYIASQGWDRSEVEIFMGVKEGDLESLIESTNCPSVGDSVFHQMLQALDFLAVNDIIHRDVKPQNILYVRRGDGQYQFQLADFGLCSRAVSAKSFVGTQIYMAPEMFQNGRQTHKIDVWSLFVTMLWTLDIEGFRRRSKNFRYTYEILQVVTSAASNNHVSAIREMAINNPEERASAAQMLVKCYKGDGLSTPLNKVPALQATPAIAAARYPGPALPVSAQQYPKGLKKVNPFTATARYRVDKPRFPLQAQRPREAFRPKTEKRLGQAFVPVAIERLRIPGAYPVNDEDCS